MYSRKITIVNRHYPPNLNITGENAWDLANYLIEKHQIDVAIVHIDRSYEGGGNKRIPVGKTVAIKTIYEAFADYFSTDPKASEIIQRKIAELKPKNI